MNYNLHLIATIHLLIATTVCSAMELEIPITRNKPTILFELATTPDEKFAAFISNNRVIINGKNSCRIMDINTNQTVLSINDTPPDNNISLHLNKKCFALCNKEKIIIYDTETGLEKWNTSSPNSIRPPCMFSPCDNTIFLWAWALDNGTGQLIQHNYKTNQVSETGIRGSTYLPEMDIHPTKQQICLFDGGPINMYDYEHHTGCYNRTSFNFYGSISRLIYSPDGSCIAVGGPQAIHIINPDNTIVRNSITSMNLFPEMEFLAIEFHPNSAVLAALVLKYNNRNPQQKNDHSCLLRYLDRNKKDIIIAETSFSNLAPLYPVRSRNALSFSSDGTKLMIKFHYECVVLPVPFEVIYQPEAKDSTLLRYWLLKNYTLEHDHNLPNDVIQILIQALLEALKR